MITCHVESFEKQVAELDAIFPMHFEELALNKDKVPLAPDYRKYFKLEREGNLFFVAMREAGVMIGYYVGIIAPALHYTTCLTCSTDIFYVLPSKRNGWAGKQLFRFVEGELKRRGVQRWYVGSKVEHDASPLFEYLDFERVEVFYSKWLGE